MVTQMRANESIFVKKEQDENDLGQMAVEVHYDLSCIDAAQILHLSKAAFI